MRHTTVETNGISLHVVEEGAGPAVLFCHGFPDTWRGWRRQMEAVAGAGYRAVAVDMRGYGRSSAPADPARYTPFHTVGDLVGLLDRLALLTVTVVGHDFGASVAWNAAMMRPDRFTAVFGVSVPYLPRGDRSFLDRIRAALYWGSATPPPAERWSPFDPGRSLLRPAPPDCPPWADTDDVAHAVAEFQRTGFRGGSTTAGRSSPPSIRPPRTRPP